MKFLILLLALSASQSANAFITILSAKDATCNDFKYTIEELSQKLSKGKGCRQSIDSTIPKMTVLECSGDVKLYFTFKTYKDCKDTLNHTPWGEGFKERHSKIDLTI